MRIFSFLQTKYGCAFQLLLVLTWLTDLKDSDSYFFVYALCALIGTICLLDNCRNVPSEMDYHWGGVTVPAFLFALMVAFANHPIYEPILAVKSLFSLCMDLLGGTVIAASVLKWLLRNLPYSIKKTENRDRPLRFFALCASSIVFIDVIYFIFCAFPGIITSDSATQMNQIYTGNFNNMNPFWHTRTIGLFVNMGKAIFGTYQAGVATFSVFQILFMAGCFSYVLMTLYQNHIPKSWITACWMVYALLPYNISYSVTMWKDILFSGACLLVTTSFYRIVKKIPQTRILDLVLFIFGGFGLCLWRTNGLLAYGVLLLAMLIAARKNGKLIGIMTVIFGACILLNGPILSAMNIGGGSYVEALSLPLQQVSRVVYEERDLEPQDLELIETIADTKTVREIYRQEISDPIKNLVRNSGADKQIQSDPVPYLKLWLRIGSQYPMDYIRAWIELTKGYWNGGYAYWVWAEGVYENNLGIKTAAAEGLIGKLFDLYFRYTEMIPFLLPVISIGFHTWLLMLCWIVNCRKKRIEWMLLLPSFSILFGLLIGTPVFSEFRYAYPMLMSCPLIICATWFTSEKMNEEA